MIAVISPSKDLDFKTSYPEIPESLPECMEHTLPLVELMQKKSANQLKKLMDISDKLASENVQRYKDFDPAFGVHRSQPAIFAFAGDVYRGLDARSMDLRTLEYCNAHVRILSGLYGLLKPFDRIQAYRLEMGISLKVGKCKNLSNYWKPVLGKLLNRDLKETKSKYLINLASQEYFDAVHLPDIELPVISVHFREKRNGKWTFLSFNAKKARGLMVRFMADQNCQTSNDLKAFDLEQYAFNKSLSSENDWYFTR